VVQKGALTLRAKLSLVLCVLLVFSIGVTGAILIYQSAQNAREHVTREHQLLAETRAFALRDNLEILEGELARLALSPQVDLTDQDSSPETQLLTDTHRESVLYNTAVLLVSADGDCIGAVPDRPEFKNRKFGGLPWFQDVKAAGLDVRFHVADDPPAGRTVNIVQPIVRRHKFVGAIIGMIALDQANIIVPSLRDKLPPSTEALLVDKAGRVIFPTDRVLVAPQSQWAAVVRAAQREESGTMSGRANDEDSLFGFATVQAKSDFVVVFRRPWSTLIEHVQKQAWSLATILLFAVLVAAAAGLFFSAYLTRPLRLLRASAARIATGQMGSATDVHKLVGGDELGALVHDFLEMEKRIAERDRDLREAANTLERRVAQRTMELEAAQKALVDVERFAAMGKTSAAIAHELKNALNGLGMAVELIVENPTSPSVGRLRTQVLSEISRLRDVVDSLSSFSRSPRLEKRTEDLSVVVRQAVETLGDLIADRGAEVTIDIPAHLMFECDGHKIQGVVMNLLKNAIEAGRKVRIRARVEGGEAVLDVADDGPGISEEARLHLFEPFFTTKPNGTGLGLPTSLRYVQAHGGRLEARAASDLGGALLQVRLPAQRERASQAKV
jgi:signal transduction histidine kinase